MDSHLSLKELPALLQSLYNLPSVKIEASAQFKALRSQKSGRDEVLNCIPTTRPSHRSLEILHLLIKEDPTTWPTLPLITAYTRICKSLSDDTSPKATAKSGQLARETSNLIKKSYTSLCDFIIETPQPALRSTTTGRHISFRGLHDFIKRFRLPGNVTGKPVVAIALPNGPVMAAVCIAVTTYYTSAPINPAAGPGQFRADVTQAGAKFILTTAQDFDKLDLGSKWVKEEGLEVCLVDWKENDDIEIRSLDGARSTSPNETKTANTGDDFALILFTSGTSGTKKVVPLTLHSIIAGVAFVVQSWDLRATDICLNMMPLYHIGGLVRNIFAPIFAGGSTVCCSAFEPNLFWDVVEDIQPTWYYASPSMHSLILEGALSRRQALKNCRIRLACNAAGGLLPSLACQLRDTFNCIVLPSYGMTECMPISTPPIDYKLDKEGTSGISTGPEIAILSWSDAVTRTGTVGRICVRGEPVFPGYLRSDGTLDKSPFNANGWFDTGDLGYMDTDGYLYITGRSKEVINRGGELISPFEVENAIMAAAMSPSSEITGRVSQVLAFSAAHDILQEVVAVAIVTPAGLPRVDLKSLQKALHTSLQQVKWPVLITYMDDLPKKNNKVLRIKLGSRLGIAELSDETPYLSRHFEAMCPPADTDLSVAIHCTPCSLDVKTLSLALEEILPFELSYHCRQRENNQVFDVIIAPGKQGPLLERKCLIADELRLMLSKTIHNYMVPEYIHFLNTPIPHNDLGNVEEDMLEQMLKQLADSSLQALGQSTQGKVTKIVADVLSRPPSELPQDIDFFSLGGDSLKAGRLVSSLRTTFNAQISINIVFNQGSIAAIATHIDELIKSSPLDEKQDSVFGCQKTYSSTNPLLMLMQLAPLVIVYPMRRAFQWTGFIVALSYMQRWPTSDHILGRLFNLTLSIMISRVIVKCIAPFIGIAAKWFIIGRYRQGLYPMWGLYHTRWWMVQKIVSICGKGFFSTNDSTRRLYYRLLGAKIGKNVKLAGAALGEWDLIDIRDGATLSRCTCRPFAAEGNTSMYLGRIIIGENASIGLASIVAAGSEVPPDTCIGPNSSSWEMEDANEENRDLSSAQAPKPHWILTCLLTFPLTFFAWMFSLLPWVGGLVGMVIDQPSHQTSPLREILDWFTQAERIGYHYLALILRCFLSPFILFTFTVLIKFLLDIILGKQAPNSGKNQGTIGTWRVALIKQLLPVKRLHDMTSLFGQHYEATSIAIRMLGGKIGKRVYWPGTGPSIGDYHLLDIGNDVVFGSRAHLITTDGAGSEKITIEDRAMIADRVCLLPGVTVGHHTTMGSGALTRRNKAYAAGGTFVGSKEGDAINLSNRQDPVHHDRSRVHHMSSDDTLDTHHNEPEKQLTRTRIHHMSSDDTLADSRQAKSRINKVRYREAEDPFTTDSDTDDNGEMHSVTNNMSPFGRAFYLNLAPYRVLGPCAIFCYSSFITVFTAFYWNVPSVSSIQIVDHIMNRFVSRETHLWLDIALMYLLSWAAIAVLATAQAFLALVFVIAAKWVLLGRRSPGNYDWDKSSYCQRWQLFLSIEKLRRQCYHSQGVLGLLTGTSWIVFYFQALGAKIGKDCSLFANGSPSLMFTEPDLITLGDRVVIDDASVVAHINTRGKFDLNKLEIGDRCVMRSGSRLLSGAMMKKDSCLLEHTLIMGGDVVEEKWTMQGWPAEKFPGSRLQV